MLCGRESTVGSNPTATALRTAPDLRKRRSGAVLLLQRSSARTAARPGRLSEGASTVRGAEAGRAVPSGARRAPLGGGAGAVVAGRHVEEVRRVAVAVGDGVGVAGG